MCVSPMSIKRPGSESAVERITVPCGKCGECLSRKRSEWSFRIGKEIKRSESAYFITLTYDNECIPVISKTGEVKPASEVLKQCNISPEKEEEFLSGCAFTLSKRDVQLFLKRLRQFAPKVALRYYLVGEYGTETKRPHYHGIFFNLPVFEKSFANNSIISEYVHKAWKLGQVHVGTVTPESINYVTKYVIDKEKEYEVVEKPFCLLSKRPAIGSNYSEYASYHRKRMQFYAIVDGKKVNLPRYYRDKFFSKMEKEIRNKKLKDEIEEKEKITFQKFEKRGENFFSHELETKIQKEERTFKKSKSHKL